MEHLERFGLEREPFRNEPQPDFWFESRSVSDAKARLLRCLRQGKELLVLCGEIGVGTTTLARRVLDELDPEAFEAGLLVVGRGVEPAWLRAAIARQLGVVAPGESRADTMRRLYEHLVALRREGRRAVIAIDEAHALGPDALAELLAILNFEHEDERLVSVLLIGSPELERMLEAEPALMGRCELCVRVEPLVGAEARAYIAHRLVVAGGDPALFAPELADVIAERAGGLPRRINALADNALFEAHLARREWPEPADVERAARDLPWARTGDDRLSGAATEVADDWRDEPVPPSEPTHPFADEEAPRAPLARRHTIEPVPEADEAQDLEFGPEDEELDTELSHTNPDHGAPGAWHHARPVSLDDEVLGASSPRLPDEEDLDNLFVDLLDDEKE